MISSFEFSVPGRAIPRRIIGTYYSVFGVVFSIYKKTEGCWVMEAYRGLGYLRFDELKELVDKNLLPEDAYRWACAFQMEATL